MERRPLTTQRRTTNPGPPRPAWAGPPGRTPNHHHHFDLLVRINLASANTFSCAVGVKQTLRLPSASLPIVFSHLPVQSSYNKSYNHTKYDGHCTITTGRNHYEFKSKLPLPLAARLQTGISTSHHDSLSGPGSQARLS